MTFGEGGTCKGGLRRGFGVGFPGLIPAGSWLCFQADTGFLGRNSILGPALVLSGGASGWGGASHSGYDGSMGRRGWRCK